jgi:hypothetical protein
MGIESIEIRRKTIAEGSVISVSINGVEDTDLSFTVPEGKSANIVIEVR